MSHKQKTVAQMRGEPKCVGWKPAVRNKRDSSAPWADAQKPGGRQSAHSGRNDSLGMAFPFYRTTKVVPSQQIGMVISERRKADSSSKNRPRNDNCTR